MPSSGDSVDQLIRELIQTARPATDEDVSRIIEAIATAPFEERLRRIRTVERGIRSGSYRLERDTPSVIYRLVKRTVMEQQWASDTTLEQYLSDLRQAVRSPSVRLAVFGRRGGAMAATLSPTRLAVPSERRAARSLPWLLVVYSADRACIVSGYQVSGSATVSLPKEAVWLR